MRLADFPRQLEALHFGSERFDLDGFSAAFDSDDPAEYTPVLAIERAFGRLQNYIAALAHDGASVAGLHRHPPAKGEPRAQPDFEALRDAGAITRDLCRRLIASQRARSLVGHDYVRASAADVYAAVERLRTDAPEFLRRYADWIEPHLLG